MEWKFCDFTCCTACAWAGFYLGFFFLGGGGFSILAHVCHVRHDCGFDISIVSM